MKSTEQGFTLIESLFVLTILLIISAITAISIKPQFEAIQDKQFLTQFQEDFLYGQQYAISHQQEVNFMIINDQHYYYLRTGYLNDPFIKRYYSNNINILSGSLSFPFKLTPSGTVNKFGSIFIQIGSRHYIMMVLIGKGRFYVVKE